MLGGAPPPDLSALLSYVVTVLVIVSGFLVVLRTAASRCFAVEAPFGTGGEGYQRPLGPEVSPMSVGGRGEDGEGIAPHCVVCGGVGTKHCAGCKAVRYCSLDCQSKHWKEEHKSKCKRKVSGTAIALIPSHGSPGRVALKVLRKPKKILFPYDEFLRLFYWDKHALKPCGLLNSGNSCFANVVLQCLASTRPLTAYLLEGIHARECRRDDWCFLCAIQAHIQKVNVSLHPFSPMSILSRLTNINRSFGDGKQEDAHEFMRFAIDTMQSVCLDEYGGEKVLDASTQETTLVQHVFGGHLQSQVICTNCNQVSNRYENMMDLTVEIQGDAESLESCLDQFTAKEWLDGENKYKCDGCNGYVKALKRLTVHQAPNILTIALKRFQSGRFGKLNKRVTFPETLDLGPYVSSTGDSTNLYSLYAVVVHLDMLNASFFGHYICYIKDFHGQWYMIDDCKVVKVDIEEVLAQGAYMLLYSRLKARQPRTFEASEANSPMTVVSSNSSSCDKPGEARLMESACERDAALTTNAGTSMEAKMHLEINVPPSCSKVQLHSCPADMDFPVLQSGSLKEQKNSPPGISNSDVNSISANQSAEPMSLDQAVVPSNGSEEAKVPFARSGGAEAGNMTCSIDPFSHANGQVKQRKHTNAADPPCDAVDLKSTTTSSASRAASSSRELKPIFSRGFLDKPLKKKPLPTKISRPGRLTNPTEVNGWSNGFCNSMQLDNEIVKSDPQLSLGTSNGSVGITTTLSAESNGGGICLPSEAIRCNGPLESTLSSLSHSKDGGTDGLLSHVSLDNPFDQHGKENGLVKMDIVQNGCDHSADSLPFRAMTGQTDGTLSECT